MHHRLWLSIIFGLLISISLPIITRAQADDNNALTILRPYSTDDSDVALPTGEFSVQIGAFAKKENAKKLATKFRNDGWQVDMFENVLDKTRTFYLVWIGSYPSLDEVHRQLAAIDEKYKIHGVIRQRIGWKKP